MSTYSPEVNEKTFADVTTEESHDNVRQSSRADTSTIVMAEPDISFYSLVPNCAVPKCIKIVESSRHMAALRELR